MGAYRKHCSDLTPIDLEPRYKGVKFPTFAVSPPAGRFRSNLSMLCRYGPPTPHKFRIDRLNDRVTI